MLCAKLPAGAHVGVALLPPPEKLKVAAGAKPAKGGKAKALPAAAPAGGILEAGGPAAAGAVSPQGLPGLPPQAAAPGAVAPPPSLEEQKKRPGQLMLTPETPDVIITNYHKLSGWADVLAPLLSTVIYDEAQELRHEDSAKYKAANHISLHTKWRMGLTATPIYNYGDELFHVTNCLMPGRLGTKQEFIEEWCIWLDD